MVATPEQRFRFARAKLSRGRSHIAELDTLLSDFISRKPVIAIQYDCYVSGQYQGTFQSFTRETLPPHAVMVFGDAVHNIRTALDHLINEVVAERRTPPTDLAFPFATRADTLGKQIREKMKDTNNAERDIIRELKPYKGGNDFLYALHELDLRDKHRSPISIDVSAESHSMKFDSYRADGTQNIVHHCTFSEVPPEIESFLTPIPGATRLGVIDQAVLIPVLAKGLPLEGTPVIDSLQRLAQTVESVIDRFTNLPNAPVAQPVSNTDGS